MTGKKKPAVRRAFPLGSLGAACLAGSVAKQEGDAPQSRQTDHDINDPRQRGGHAAAEIGDEIHLEQSDAASVQPADDGEKQGDFI